MVTEDVVPPSPAVIGPRSGSRHSWQGRDQTFRDTRLSTSPRQPGNKDTRVRTETRDDKKIYNERMFDKMCYHFDVGDDIVGIK